MYDPSFMSYEDLGLLVPRVLERSQGIREVKIGRVTDLVQDAHEIVSFTSLDQHS